MTSGGAGPVDDAVVDEINRLSLRGGLRAVERLGRYLLATLFDGDPARFAVEHEAHATWRALGRHPRLRPSRSSLWYAVRTVEQLERLPPEVGRRLSATHHRHLTPLEPGVRAELAVRSVEEGWTVRELRAEIARRKPVEPAPSQSRVLARLARRVAALARLSDAELAALDPSARAALRQEVAATRALVESLTVNVAMALRQGARTDPE